MMRACIAPLGAELIAAAFSLLFNGNDIRG